MPLKVICAEDNPAIIRHQMDRPLHDLQAVYQRMNEAIRGPAVPREKLDLAQWTISWILGARLELQSKELLKALRWKFGDYMVIAEADVISACNHFVVVNKAKDTFEFGHFSVREFFQEQIMYREPDIHDFLAESWLQVLHLVARANEEPAQSKGTRAAKDVKREEYVKSIGDYSTLDSSGIEDRLSFLRSFYPYAQEFWAYHCEKSARKGDQNNTWEHALTLWRQCQGRLTPEYWLRRGTFLRTIGSISDRLGFSMAAQSDGSETESHRHWHFLVACQYPP